MKKIAILLAIVLGMALFPKVASADSEYSVTINATWLDAYISGCAELNPTTCDYSTSFGKFTSTFDVYGNGTLVPGTMSFTVSGDVTSLEGVGGMTYDTTPPTFSGSACDAPNCPITLTAPFSWSSTNGLFISFAPPWPPVASGTLPLATLDLNCTGDDCAVFFQCDDILCAAGGTNAPTVGSITVAAITAPEPSMLLLLLMGVVPVLIFRILKFATIRRGSRGSISLSTT